MKQIYKRSVLTTILSVVVLLIIMTDVIIYAAETEDFSFVITSDPQYPWTDKTDAGESEPGNVKKRRSKELIRQQYESINDYHEAVKNNQLMIINGDMTAYGHLSEWFVIERKLKRLKMPYAYGLGNHDIENNWYDTFRNNAWRRSFAKALHHIDEVPNLLAKDVQVTKHFPWRRTYTGSLSYSFQLGDFRVIQAQNHPMMNYTSHGRLTYSLIDGIDWILQQLEEAKQKNEPVLLNVHKPLSIWWGDGEKRAMFSDKLEEYHEEGILKAVFHGHYHTDLGESEDWELFDQLPVYYSGSASQRSYLINEVREGQLSIYKVQENDWRNKELISVID
ncbi:MULTISPECIES: metallophosphoesterase [unclassified Enterococcus]|uniref:metallophosphoesterase n=1 Tax=unclassified Enterococcus TaxID=2608891 RepID=UPI0013EAA000|nr:MULTISPECIES: metallophosphoesterase [unclassified Enterococcus]